MNVNQVHATQMLLVKTQMECSFVNAVLDMRGMDLLAKVCVIKSFVIMDHNYYIIVIRAYMHVCICSLTGNTLL